MDDITLSKKISNLNKKITQLPKKNQEKIEYEYEQKKRNITSAWLLRLFGWHYLHIGKGGLRLLFVVSCYFGIGIIRWIVQAFQLKNNIEKRNFEILEMIYQKYV